MKCSLGISNFLEEISSLSHSIVFLYFFALITGKAFLSLLGILWSSAFKWVYPSFSPLLFASLLFTAICKASSDIIVNIIVIVTLTMALHSSTLAWKIPWMEELGSLESMGSLRVGHD